MKLAFIPILEYNRSYIWPRRNYPAVIFSNSAPWGWGVWRSIPFRPLMMIIKPGKCWSGASP